ncbi:MAG: diguanylate cyclase [Cellvibrionaceae bacterium]
MVKPYLLAATVLALLATIGSSDRANSDVRATVPDAVVDEATTSVKVTDMEALLTPPGLLPGELAALEYASAWQALETADLRDSDNSVWLRFNVRHEVMRDRNWWVVLSWAMLDHVQMHVKYADNSEWWSSRPLGEAYPLADRYIEHRYFLLPLALSAGETATVYLEIRSSNLLAVPVEIWDRSEFIAADQWDLIALGALFGSLAIMFFYNLSLYTILRDKAYLSYCGYVAAVFLYLLVVTGVGVYYLWDYSLWLKQRGLGVFACLSFLAATVFVRHFLELERYGGWLLRANTFLIVAWSALLFACMVLSAPLLLGFLINTFSFLSMAIATLTGCYLWRRSILARIFIVSWTTLGVGTTVFVLTLLGTLPLNFFTRYSQMMGIVLEMAILSYALAYRINEAKLAREASNKEALLLTQRVSDERSARLKAQQETLAVQTKLNEELETRVQQRTEELNETMKQLARANTELIKLSGTDPLTDVPNRRYLDEMLIAESKRAHRGQLPLAVVLLDIDHFKPINDHHGHAVGDRCLSAVAKALGQVVQRPGDLLARYGGEEFVFLLPNTNENQATEVADRGRRAVEALSFPVDGEEIKLTISAGIAAWVPAEEEAHRDLMKAADEALYRAKNAGRNCVMSATPRVKQARL